MSFNLKILPLLDVKRNLDSSIRFHSWSQELSFIHSFIPFVRWIFLLKRNCEEWRMKNVKGDEWSFCNLIIFILKFTTFMVSVAVSFEKVSQESRWMKVEISDHVTGLCKWDLRCALCSRQSFGLTLSWLRTLRRELLEMDLTKFSPLWETEKSQNNPRCDR